MTSSAALYRARVPRSWTLPVECVARAGELEKARFYFEKMLSYANHLGLFAEETGRSGEQIGNFPQAFTHLSLISAALYLDKALSQTGSSNRFSGRHEDP